MFHECMIRGFKIPKIIKQKTRKKRKKPKNKTGRCKGVFLRSRKKRKKIRIKEKKRRVTREEIVEEELTIEEKSSTLVNHFDMVCKKIPDIMSLFGTM